MSGYITLALTLNTSVRYKVCIPKETNLHAAIIWLTKGLNNVRCAESEGNGPVPEGKRDYICLQNGARQNFSRINFWTYPNICPHWLKTCSGW